MVKILLVCGTRPEAVKLCPLLSALRRQKHLRPLLLSTGQHREVLDETLSAFGETPDYRLDVCRPTAALPELTSTLLVGISGVIGECRPAAVLVQGDTATAFAGALAAFYADKSILLGHVEAGLRTHDLTAPFPEEWNRRSISLLARWHFAPSTDAAANLLAEGVPPERIFVTGNTVVDALRQTVDPAYTGAHLAWADGRPLLLLTLHRRESWGAPIREMLQTIREVLEEYPAFCLLYPLHPNPAVAEPARTLLADCPQIRLTEPLTIRDFHNLEARAVLCLTDSGGVQEECTALCRPALVLRNTTERPEGVAAGFLRVVGTDTAALRRTLRQVLTELSVAAPALPLAAPQRSPYGDGFAGEKIAAILQKELCDAKRTTFKKEFSKMG